MVDILIRNGEVLDGSGAKGYKADVAIQGDRIVEIGDLSGMQADLVIDATGKTVAPGFIDMHSHSDMTLPFYPDSESMVRQGITTLVTGNCGISPVPLAPATRDQVIASMFGGEKRFPWDQLNSFGSFLDYLEKNPTAQNFVGLIGQGAIRAAVMGFSAARPTEEQMEDMQKLVAESMEQGAFGISTGLIYPPGSYASTDELIEVTKPVGERKGIYFSHIRGEGDTLLDALAEAIEIGRQTGAAVQISHYKAAGRDNWDKAVPGLDLIQNARNEGLDVTADMYPYTAGGTSLVAILPEWAQEGGLEDIARRLSDPATRAKMTQDMKTTGFFRVAEWDKVLIGGSKNPDYVGHFISELAEKAGKTPYDWIFDALLETQGEMGMMLFMMSEENIRKELPRPFMMIGTDGVGVPAQGDPREGLPHPRSFGTFPRVLGQLVREEHVIPLETAINKMTGMPAEKLGLKERGYLKEGFFADVVVFDPLTVRDETTYQKPNVYPTGIDTVIVNGVPVICAGQAMGKRPGRVVRRSA